MAILNCYKFFKKENELSLKYLINSLLEKHQIKARFGLVGIWNTLFGYFVFVGMEILFSRLLGPKAMAYMTALIIANIVSIINAYIFHKYITFKSQVKGKAIFVEFFRFSMTYLGTFLLSLALLPIFVEFIKLSPKLAGALIIFICMIISYLGHSRFSFRSCR